MSMTKKNEKGFTLVEVLVALTVTALMLTAVYQTVSSATTAREKLRVENARFHMARIVTERIGRELRSLHVIEGDELPLFRGGIGGGDMELLSFTTTASTPLAKQPGLPARVSYRLEVEPDKDRTSYRINRIETSPLGIDEGRPYKLAEGLSDVEVRFLANDNWVGRWDGRAAKSYPQAVSLTVTTGYDDDATVFRTVWEIGEL